jgi:hypothetical protein
VCDSSGVNPERNAWRRYRPEVVDQTRRADLIQKQCVLRVSFLLVPMWMFSALSGRKCVMITFPGHAAQRGDAVPFQSENEEQHQAGSRPRCIFEVEQQ